MTDPKMILDMPSKAEVSAIMQQARKDRGVAAQKFLRTAFAGFTVKKKTDADDAPSGMAMAG